MKVFQNFHSGTEMETSRLPHQLGSLVSLKRKALLSSWDGQMLWEIYLCCFKPLRFDGIFSMEHFLAYLTEIHPLLFHFPLWFCTAHWLLTASWLNLSTLMPFSSLLPLLPVRNTLQFFWPSATGGSHGAGGPWSECGFFIVQASPKEYRYCTLGQREGKVQVFKHFYLQLPPTPLPVFCHDIFFVISPRFIFRLNLFS